MTLWPCKSADRQGAQTHWQGVAPLIEVVCFVHRCTRLQMDEDEDLTGTKYTWRLNA